MHFTILPKGNKRLIKCDKMCGCCFETTTQTQYVQTNSTYKLRDIKMVPLSRFLEQSAQPTRTFFCDRMEEDRAVRQKLSDVPFHIDPSVISSIADAVSRIQNSLKTNYASATDPAFAARLEKALQKNLDYIEKCVLLMLFVV